GLFKGALGGGDGILQVLIGGEGCGADHLAVVRVDHLEWLVGGAPLAGAIETIFLGHRLPSHRAGSRNACAATAAPGAPRACDDMPRSRAGQRAQDDTETT